MFRFWAALTPEWSGLVSALPAALATLFAALLTACATIVAVGLNLLFTRVWPRGERERRAALLAEAKDRVAFWQQWYEAQSHTKPTAEQDTLRARWAAEVDAVERELRRGLAGPAKPNSAFRRALLLYKPANMFAWLPRILFYYWAFGVARYLKQAIFEFSLIRTLDENGPLLVKPSSPPPDHLTLGYLWSAVNPTALAQLLLVTAVTTTFVFALIASVFFLRWLAVDLDRDDLPLAARETWKSAAGLLARLRRNRHKVAG